MNQVAVNTFSDGLMTDLNPLSTPNTVLTDCINGTIITYNGNEFTLQNDLGNVKMENIFFPKGYVPVGMKEYGGIIYVALYSPSNNKCELGSFPSPQTISFGLDDIKTVVSITGTQLRNADNEMVKVLKPLFEMTDKLNPGDQYRINISQTGTTIPKFDQSDPSKIFKIKYFYQTEDGKITPVEYSDIYKTSDNTFGYFKGTSGAIILVSYEIDKLKYFNANITASDNQTINIAAKGEPFDSSQNLFKGFEIKAYYSNEESDFEKSYYSLGAGVYNQEINLGKIENISTTKNINIELTPYSDYGFFKDMAIKRTYTPNDVASMAKDLNTTFKYYVESDNIKIDFNFKYNTSNLDLFVELYDPWSDVSTIKKIDDPTPYGINTVLFDLVDEPRKKEIPTVSLGGIPMAKVETKIIGGDNDYNKEKYHAVIPVPKSGENFIYVRKTSELRKNHFYILRVVCVEPNLTNDGFIYKYFVKSLYTMDILNDYFNTIDDYETINLEVNNVVSLDYEIVSDNITDNPSISDFDDDSKTLMTNDNPYLVSDTTNDKTYFYSSEYSTKRNVDLNITYNSSSIFGDFKSESIVLTPDTSIISNAILPTPIESFTPVTKIGSTGASSDKDLGKSSISIGTVTKNLFNYKLDLNYKTYRNISSNKIQDYEALQYFQEFPIRSALLLPSDIYSGWSTSVYDASHPTRFQKGSCASLKQSESGGEPGTLYPTKNGSGFIINQYADNFDDNLGNLITIWRGNTRRNISAFISNIVTDQYYFIDTFNSNTIDSTKYTKDYPKDQRISWRNCMLVISHATSATTSFVRIHNYNDIVEFFDNVYICSITPSNKYIYYPNSSTIQSISNGTTTFKQTLKVNASISTLDSPMFEFYTRKDDFSVVKDFNDTSISSFVSHLPESSNDGKLPSTIVSTQVGSNKYIYPITSINNLINKDIEIVLPDYSITKSSNPIIGGVVQDVTSKLSLGGQLATEAINIIPPTNNGGLYIKDNKSIKLKNLLNYINVTGLGGSDISQETITKDSFLINFGMKSSDTTHRGRWREGEDGPNMYDDYVYET